MNNFKIFLIISILIKSCFGGSSSLCGPLWSKFVILSEASNIIIDNSVEFLTELSIESPVSSNGAASSLNCKIDLLKTLIADGVNRLAGSDSSYVADILSGLVTPSFEDPLDCIQDGLLSLKDALNNANNFDADVIINNFVAANVSSDASCSSLQSTVMTAFELLGTKIEQKISGFSYFISNFKELNMLDLFENFLVSQISCDSAAIAVAIADMVNGDKNEAFGYTHGLKPQLSYPLDCVQSFIDDSSSRLDSSYSEIVVAAENA